METIFNFGKDPESVVSAIRSGFLGENCLHEFLFDWDIKGKSIETQLRGLGLDSSLAGSVFDESVSKLMEAVRRKKFALKGDLRTTDVIRLVLGFFKKIAWRKCLKFRREMKSDSQTEASISTPSFDKFEHPQSSNLPDDLLDVEELRSLLLEKLTQTTGTCKLLLKNRYSREHCYGQAQLWRCLRDALAETPPRPTEAVKEQFFQCLEKLYESIMAEGDSLAVMQLREVNMVGLFFLETKQRGLLQETKPVGTLSMAEAARKFGYADEHTATVTKIRARRELLDIVTRLILFKSLN
jgi:hypothetical protein